MDIDFANNIIFNDVYSLLFDSNVFSILKFDSSEIRHTNMIEWILSLDNYLGLKRLIKLFNDFNIDVNEISDIEFYNDKPFNVLFENSTIKERPDLLIRFKFNGKLYNMLIENKIDAFENEYENGMSQTELYYDEIKRLGLIDKTIFIFLDAKGNDSKCNEYNKLNYNDFYNEIIKGIDVNGNDYFIYEQYVNSLMKPVICDNDIMVDTIYAIDDDIDYESVYTEESNEYIRNHYNDEVKDKDYLTLKYIYYCINYKDDTVIEDDIKEKLFGTKRKTYKWKYNGVYSTNLDIVKHLCIDLYDNDKELLDRLFNVKVGADDLLCKDIVYLSKNNDAWVEYLSKHKTTIDDYYIKLKEDLYVRNYITYDVMEMISKCLKDTKYKIESK